MVNMRRAERSSIADLQAICGPISLPRDAH
jgi:hypothetical protein